MPKVKFEVELEYETFEATTESEIEGEMSKIVFGQQSVFIFSQNDEIESGILLNGYTLSNFEFKK